MFTFECTQETVAVMDSAEVGQKSAYISCKVEEGLEGLVVVAFSLHARVIGEGLMNYSLPGLPF